MAGNGQLTQGFAGFQVRNDFQGNGHTDAQILNPGAIKVREGHPLIIGTDGRIALAAVTGTNEIQTHTMGGGPTGGTFTATFGGQTTAAIPYNATAAQYQAALQALSSIGANNVTVTGGAFPGTPFVVTFVGSLAATNVPDTTFTNTGLTGGTTPAVTSANTTPGVVGRVTSTALAGFSMEWEEGPLDANSGYDRSYALAPIEMDLPFGGKTATGTVRELKYFYARKPNIYTARVHPLVQVTQALLNPAANVFDIGWNPTPGVEHCYIETRTTVNPLVRIIQIQPGELGKFGGKVDFLVEGTQN